MNAFQISLAEEKFVFASDDERLLTAWFETFSLVQKHIVGGEKKNAPAKTGWLMKKIGSEGVGFTTLWKSRWCELYESHLEFYDNEQVQKRATSQNLHPPIFFLFPFTLIEKQAPWKDQH